jgi:SPP1 family predicted phage head-tail adaptor
MIMQAGAFDRKITIEQVTETRGSGGEVTSTWSTYKTVWANFRPISTKEALESDQQTASRIVEFTVRTLDAPLVNEKMRISYNGGTYEIEGVSVYGRNEIIKLKTKYKY